jgi:hypothetical protein
MWHEGRGKQVLVTAVLVLTLGGCTVEQSWGGSEDMEGAQTEAPEFLEQEESVSELGSAGQALSCEDIRPEELGLSRSVILRANGPEAACGPGVSNGAGYLALLNSGPLGAVAWTVVTANGRPTGTLFGGTEGARLVPLRSGFHILRFSFPNNVTLSAHSADGQFLRQHLLSPGPIEAVDIAPDPRGGVVIAWWTPGESGAWNMMLQAFDEKGRPRFAPRTVMTVSTSEPPGILVGVDQRGRTLVLWLTAESSTWKGQWLRWDGTARSTPFLAAEDPNPSDVLGSRLQPLSGEGLVLQLHSQWVRQFPSAEPTSLPAPSWLADNPGTELTLIRRGRAYVLVPPPSPIEGSGCQERLRFYTREGVACGDLTLPFGGSSCMGRQPGIGPDGTVVQQIELNIPANDQCAWRWWPRLLR